MVMKDRANDMEITKFYDMYGIGIVGGYGCYVRVMA